MYLETLGDSLQSPRINGLNENPNYGVQETQEERQLSLLSNYLGG